MATAANKALKMQPETEIAVLQVQVRNIEDKIGELKVDLKDVSDSIDRQAANTNAILKDMKDVSTTAHKAMSDKINSLEKWRWMLMGAGVILGSIGFDSIARLLK
jgi:hypothetical protein